MKKLLFLVLIFVMLAPQLEAQRRNRSNNQQEKEQTQEQEKSILSNRTFSALKLRNIGPAFPSGRIADIAIHPEDDNVWYIAVGSGGVWKTTNAGTTFQSIFDGQGSYSTGCITIDPNNPNIIWVGTGENVGGRHVGFGDGIYKSMDGGKSWKNMGLKESEHIGKIMVHPENSNVIYVAVQGPLWNSGGERGFYKSTDGGTTWKKTLGDEEWTGVTDIVIDPRNPDRIYAATWQRHRTVAAYMGGGPESGIHKSEDGGETWTPINKGIPGGNRGKIGIAISPMKPDVLYAAVELNQTNGAVFKSTDRGASWVKQSNTVSGGTGPHYYQELIASPHHFDRLYLMAPQTLESRDGGKTFFNQPGRGKHSDNHALAFRRDDPDYLLAGTDGGIYESFDDAQTWRFFDNLPLVQYYKVAVDDRAPFYWVYGGTQDNGSHGGPSRTDKSDGIMNGDWIKTLGADGHQSATEPGNPDIMYAESQQGNLHRVDITSGEQISIQPQPREGEPYERYNWDAPILVSPHKPSRLYFASQRVWKSEDRGDTWTPISEDLTKDQNRVEMPIMGRVQSFDSPWDFGAMSVFNTITSLAESPVQEGIIYAGTDDGIIQVTENGGASWRKIPVSDLPGVPANAFVNDIRADLHDANTVYVCLDNHKEGDFTPYIYKSTDRGASWTSIRGDLPDRTLMWRTVQDHVKPELLFAATEWGLYFTLSGGEKWYKLTGPTISFRDVTIQRRENDLVGASFGRGFFILDDYSPLREITEENAEEVAMLFKPRKAWQFRPRNRLGSLGTAEYRAENPTYGAEFTYYLNKEYPSLAADRKKKEAALNKKNENIPFPGWEALEKEREETKPSIMLVVKDSDGNVVRKIDGPARKGMHRVAWDLQLASKNVINPSQGQRGGWSFGTPAMPGTYSVALYENVKGESKMLAGPVNFEVELLHEGALEGNSESEILAFRKSFEGFQETMGQVNTMLSESMSRVNAMETALNRTPVEPGELDKQLYELKMKMTDIQKKVNGGGPQRAIGERTDPTLQSRMWTAMSGLFSNYGPTNTQRESLKIAQKQIGAIKDMVMRMREQEIPKMEKALMDAGAPWIAGQPLGDNH
jgi:photosystem II stability/assembly factor-like uncharacterized protein